MSIRGRSITILQMIGSHHASPRRLAATQLEQLDARPELLERLADRAAELVGADAMIVVVRDAGGRIAWQLLPRAS